MIIEKESENKIENKKENIEIIKKPSFIEEGIIVEKKKDQIKLTDFFGKKVENNKINRLQETLAYYSLNSKNLQKIKKISK